MSLYANETVEIYNELTGELEISSLEAQHTEEVQAILDAGVTLESLEAHNGWKMVREFIEANINRNKEVLVDTTEPGKIARLQASVKSYRNILALVDGAIAQARALKQQQTLETGQSKE